MFAMHDKIKTKETENKNHKNKKKLKIEKQQGLYDFLVYIKFQRPSSKGVFIFLPIRVFYIGCEQNFIPHVIDQFSFAVAFEWLILHAL